MANEYLINRSDLVSVADAIRSKGETTEQLVFPGGFVTAIHDISTGVALNFQVVGGTAAPANPTENTIWVNTDQTITSWVFSHNQPKSPSEGMVWIVNGASTISEFDAVSDVSLRVQVAGAKQYVSGSWVKKTAQVYQNGVWVSLPLYLIQNGTDHTGVTGGWKTGVGWGYTSDVVSPTITFADGLMKVTYPNKALMFGGVSTKNQIDMTNYNTLEVLCSSARSEGNSYPSSGGGASLHLVCSKTTNTRDVTANIVYRNSATNKTVTIDVSGLTGLYYIGIYSATFAETPVNLYAHINKIELKR